MNHNIARSDQPQDEDFGDCPECEGTGDQLVPETPADDEPVPCPHCAGRGWIIRKPDQEIT